MPVLRGPPAPSVGRGAYREPPAAHPRRIASPDSPTKHPKLQQKREQKSSCMVRGKGRLWWRVSGRRRTGSEYNHVITSLIRALHEMNTVRCPLAPPSFASVCPGFALEAARGLRPNDDCLMPALPSPFGFPANLEIVREKKPSGASGGSSSSSSSSSA